jgi:hypothetical protein
MVERDQVLDLRDALVVELAPTVPAPGWRTQVMRTRQ